MDITISVLISLGTVIASAVAVIITNKINSKWHEREIKRLDDALKAVDEKIEKKEHSFRECMAELKKEIHDFQKQMIREMAVLKTNQQNILQALNKNE